MIRFNWYDYRIAGMFGGDKVWRIASSKVVGKKKVWRMPTAALRGLLFYYEMDWQVKKFGWFKVWRTPCYSPNFPAIWYMLWNNNVLNCTDDEFINYNVKSVHETFNVYNRVVLNETQYSIQDKKTFHISVKQLILLQWTCSNLEFLLKVLHEHQYIQYMWPDLQKPAFSFLCALVWKI